MPKWVTIEEPFIGRGAQSAILQVKLIFQLEQDFLLRLGLPTCIVSAMKAKSSATGNAHADKTRVVNHVRPLFSTKLEKLAEQMKQKELEGICDAAAIALAGRTS
jgi:Holliday junction resolvasome RuvABC endonuclease subunit